jgi:hypothetical protein
MSTKDESTASRPTLKLSLRGEGISFDREISQDEAARVIGLVLGGAAGFASGEKSRIGTGSAATSIREFLDGVGAKTNTKKILAIGQFLIEHGGKESFTREEVRGEFRRAKESFPANYPRDFNSTIGSGWIAEVHGSPGEYYVTRKGSEALETGNSKSDGVARSRSRRQSKVARKKQTPHGRRKAEPKEKARSTTGRSRRSGAQTSVRELAAGPFFDSPRTNTDVQKHLESKRASRFELTALSGPLATLVREGVLDREKNKDNVYEYTRV